MTIKNGDIILVKVNEFTTWYRWLLAKLIQLFDRNYYHHCMIYIDGKIHEADAKGVVVNDFSKYANDEILVFRPIHPLSEAELMALIYFAEQQLGKPYDYWGTMFFQLIYRLTGLWLGKSYGHAQAKLYCSEHCVLPYNAIRGYFHAPWKVSPGDLRRSSGYFFVAFEGKSALLHPTS